MIKIAEGGLGTFRVALIDNNNVEKDFGYFSIDGLNY
jgi:hypothetical protein